VEDVVGAADGGAVDAGEDVVGAAEPALSLLESEPHPAPSNEATAAAATNHRRVGS